MTPRLLPVALAILALAACGGGGGDTSTASGSAGAPAAGGAPSAGGTTNSVAPAFQAFGPVQIATNTGFTQSPVVARLAGGGTVVVWESGGAQVLAQRVDANGGLLGAPTVVAPLAAAPNASTARPAVAGLAGGGFAVAWPDMAANGAPVVMVRHFDAAGGPTGAALQGSPAVNGVGELDAVALPAGGFAVAWSATPATGGSTRVGMQRFDANGQPAGAAQSAAASTDAQRQPRLTVRPDGSLVLAWLQSGPPSALPSYTVTLQRFDAAGGAMGTPRPIASATDNVTFQFDVAGLSNGTLALVWQSFGVTAGVAKLNLQLLGADGTPAGASTLVAGANGVSVFDPEVAALGAAGFVVTWQQLQPSTIRQTNAQLHAQRFAASGAAIDQPQVVTEYGLQTTTGQATGRSSVVGGSDGHYVVAYDDWLAGSRIQVLGR